MNLISRSTVNIIDFVINDCERRLGMLGSVYTRKAGPAEWAGPLHRVDFHPLFIWQMGLFLARLLVILCKENCNVE